MKSAAWRRPTTADAGPGRRDYGIGPDGLSSLDRVGLDP